MKTKLHPNSEPEVSLPSENRSPLAIRLARFSTSRHSFNASLPFAPWALGLGLALAFGIFILSCSNGGTTSFGLNIVTSCLFVALIIFIILGYSDVTIWESDETYPLLYHQSQQKVDFVRFTLRPAYLAVVVVLETLTFIGATISGYHWFHYCKVWGYSVHTYSANFYNNDSCYLRASSADMVFFESFLGYTLVAVLLIGVIIPAVSNLDSSFRFREMESARDETHPPTADATTPVATAPVLVTQPITPSAVPRSRQPFLTPLLLLSVIIIIPGFLTALSNLDIWGGDGSAITAFAYLTIHHFTVSCIFSFIRDFDRATYVPTLHTKTACRVYVWSLIPPLLMLISGAVFAIQDVSTPHHGRHGEAEVVLDCVEIVVLLMMMTTAVYQPYPSNEALTLVSDSAHLF